LRYRIPAVSPVASEQKTKKNDASVEDFLESVEHEGKRSDSFVILDMMKDITGEEATMWGDSMVGFGEYHYNYKSGREGDWPLIGFSPRKQNLTLYLMYGVEQHQDLLSKLGKHKLGKICLYLNKLADVDMKVLRELTTRAFEEMKKQDTG